MSLLDIIRGRVPGLSDEEDRGRKELLWIGAAIWVTPLFTLIGQLGSTVQASEIAVLGGFQLLNFAVFAALARGRSWARKLTLFFTAPAALGNLAFAVAGLFNGVDASSGVYLTTLVNAAVFTTASWTLWRSPAVRAYMESHARESFVFPKGRADRQAVLPDAAPIGFGLPTDRRPPIEAVSVRIHEGDEKPAR
jgi:hypothetical protein